MVSIVNGTLMNGADRMSGSFVSRTRISARRRSYQERDKKNNGHGRHNQALSQSKLFRSGDWSTNHVAVP
jgi:hypothetical protein